MEGGAFMLHVLNVWTVPAVVTAILLTALCRRTAVFDAFLEGARAGVRSCMGIFPSLLGLITAVSMLRAFRCAFLISKKL